MPEASAAPEPAQPWLGRTLTAFGPFLGLIAISALFAALRWDTFVSWDNFAIIFQQTAVIGIAALGMTLIIITGGIDLSVGSVVALATVVIAQLISRGHGPAAAVLAGVAAAAVCGTVSGLLITRLKLLPFIVTLALMGSLRGVDKRLADNQTIFPDETWINRLMVLGDKWTLPGGVWLMLGLAALTGWLLRYTRFGRHVFAIGSNELTARLCGVPVERVKFLVYTLGGLFAGVAGVLQFAYLTGGDPTTAVGLELNIIAAVVIGGASLTGGYGTITGTMVGALIMSVVANGCSKVGLSNADQEILTGLIILGAALLDKVRHRNLAA